MHTPAGEESSSRGWLLLLLIPFVALLWPPFYNGTMPMVAGLPYFLWYQFLWVLITVVITAVVYVKVR